MVLARVHIFKWATASELTWKEFGAAMEAHQDTNFLYQGQERRLYGKLQGDYIRGLLITVRGGRRFTELVSDDEGGLTVDFRDLDRGRQLMDFNFFVANCRSGFGLYQHYHQSVSLGSFGNILNSRFRRMAAEHANKKCAELVAREGARKRGIKKRQSEIRRRYDGGLLTAPYVREEEFEQLVGEFASIFELKVSLATITTIEPWLKPYADESQAEVRIFRFDRSRSAEALYGALGALSQHRDKIERAVVTGEDAEGRGMRLSLDYGDNLAVAFQLDYDELAGTMRFPVSEFADNPFVHRLEQHARQNTAVFEREVKLRLRGG